MLGVKKYFNINNKNNVNTSNSTNSTQNDNSKLATALVIEVKTLVL